MDPLSARAERERDGHASDARARKSTALFVSKHREAQYEPSAGSLAKSEVGATAAGKTQSQRQAQPGAVVGLIRSAYTGKEHSRTERGVDAGTVITNRGHGPAGHGREVDRHRGLGVTSSVVDQRRERLDQARVALNARGRPAQPPDCYPSKCAICSRPTPSAAGVASRLAKAISVSSVPQGAQRSTHVSTGTEIAAGRTSDSVARRLNASDRAKIGVSPCHARRQGLTRRRIDRATRDWSSAAPARSIQHSGARSPD